MYKIIISIICILSPIFLKAQTQSNYSKALWNGDTLSIQRISIGCFNFENELLRICIVDDSLQIELFDFEIEEIKNNPITSTEKIYPVQVIKLSTDSISILQKFETELFMKRGNGCTTEDSYIVNYGTKSQNIDDSSCEWNGFNQLLKSYRLK